MNSADDLSMTHKNFKNEENDSENYYFNYIM